MISNEEKDGWHYLAVKKLTALLHKKTSSHKGDFYCLNYLNSFLTENRLKLHEKAKKIRDFCEVILLSEKTVY